METTMMMMVVGVGGDGGDDGVGTSMFPPLGFVDTEVKLVRKWLNDGIKKKIWFVMIPNCFCP